MRDYVTLHGGVKIYFSESRGKFSFKFGGSRKEVLSGIAWHLSHIQRWSGAVPYSVLQHSYAVADLVREKRPSSYFLYLHGLLHDAHEAVTSDIPSPVKKMLGKRIFAFQKAFDNELFKLLKLGQMNTAEQKIVESADTAMMLAEGNYFKIHESSAKVGVAIVSKYSRYSNVGDAAMEKHFTESI